MAPRRQFASSEKEKAALTSELAVARCRMEAVEAAHTAHPMDQVANGSTEQFEAVQACLAAH